MTPDTKSDLKRFSVLVLVSCDPSEASPFLSMIPKPMRQSGDYAKLSYVRGNLDDPDDGSSARVRESSYHCMV